MSIQLTFKGQTPVTPAAAAIIPRTGGALCPSRPTDMVSCSAGDHDIREDVLSPLCLQTWQDQRETGDCQN